MNTQPTSIAANESRSRQKAEAERNDICNYLRWHPMGGTDEEMQDALPHINANAFRARRGECVTQERIQDSRRTRPTRSGKQAIVWEMWRPEAELF